MPRGLTIGEFAQLTHLSVRTLRRYHESGLLAPAAVDPASGYRYYSSAQIPTAQVIHQLRRLDVPLAEVGEILKAEDPEERADLIAGHLRNLEAQLDRTRAAVTSLRQLLRPDPGELRVRRRTDFVRTVAAVADTVGIDDVMAWYADAMAAIDAAVAGHRSLGAPGGLYENELFTQGRGHLVVFRPVEDPPERGRVRPTELPAAELVTTVHHGPHDDLAITYGRLGEWVVGHALAVAGPVRETYLVGPRDDPDQGSWRTEIGWPVFAVGAV